MLEGMIWCQARDSVGMIWCQAGDSVYMRWCRDAVQGGGHVGPGPCLARYCTHRLGSLTVDGACCLTTGK